MGQSIFRSGHAVPFLLGILLLASAGCGSNDSGADREVVIYTSLDQRLSEPILRDFERETGIRARVVYDTEATKTAGLVNRLLAEKERPQADVFWNSEIIRTIVLAREGVLAPYFSPEADSIPEAFKDAEGYWTGFAARVRVLGVNTEMLGQDDWPASPTDLLDPAWNGRFAMAYPLFGTTSFHVAALFALLGETEAQDQLSALRDNGARVVNGNSTARDLVVAGEVPVCFTDSDDVAVAVDRGEPIDMVVFRVPRHGILLIPNTVALIRGGPHPAEGHALIDYLLSARVEEALARAPGAQIPLRPGAYWPPVVPRFEPGADGALDYDAIADHLQQALAFSKETFLR